MQMLRPDALLVTLFCSARDAFYVWNRASPSRDERKMTSRRRVLPHNIGGFSDVMTLTDSLPLMVSAYARVAPPTSRPRGPRARRSAAT